MITIVFIESSEMEKRKFTNQYRSDQRPPTKNRHERRILDIRRNQWDDLENQALHC